MISRRSNGALAGLLLLGCLFALLLPPTSHAAGNRLADPQGGKRPLSASVERWVAPGRAEEQVSVLCQTLVDGRGRVPAARCGLRVGQAPSATAERAVRHSYRALRKARFLPALVDGAPATVSAAVQFRFDCHARGCRAGVLGHHRLDGDPALAAQEVVDPSGPWFVRLLNSPACAAASLAGQCGGLGLFHWLPCLTIDGRGHVVQVLEGSGCSAGAAGTPRASGDDPAPVLPPALRAAAVEVLRDSRFLVTPQDGVELVLAPSLHLPGEPSVPRPLCREVSTQFSKIGRRVCESIQEWAYRRELAAGASLVRSALSMGDELQLFNNNNQFIGTPGF